MEPFFFVESKNAPRLNQVSTKRKSSISYGTHQFVNSYCSLLTADLFAENLCGKTEFRGGLPTRLVIELF